MGMKNDTVNVKKQALIDLFMDAPIEVVQIAYLYAKNYHKYGVDVVKDWDTAVQQSEALRRSYMQGVYDTEKLIGE